MQVKRMKITVGRQKARHAKPQAALCRKHNQWSTPEHPCIYCRLGWR